MEGVALDFVSPMAEVHALLRVLLKTREGIKLLKLYRDHNMALASYPDNQPDPVIGIVEQMETRALMCSIEDAQPKSLENAIEAYILAVKDSTRRSRSPKRSRSRSREEARAPGGRAGGRRQPLRR